MKGSDKCGNRQLIYKRAKAALSDRRSNRQLSYGEARWKQICGMLSVSQ